MHFRFDAMKEDPNMPLDYYLPESTQATYSSPLKSSKQATFFTPGPYLSKKYESLQKLDN
jgi:hypothetical protein